MITQKEIDETCECLLTKYTYAPYANDVKSDVPLDISPEDLEFTWEFISCTRPDITTVSERPKLKNSKNVIIYDCGTQTWVELNPLKIITVEHPLFTPCTEKETFSTPMTGWDPQSMEFVEFGNMPDYTPITCCDAVQHGLDDLEGFNKEKYLTDVKNYIDNIEIDNDKDAWSVNFNTFSFIIDWVTMFEELEFSEQALAEKRLDIKKCGDRWKLLIQQKAEEAVAFLGEQKSVLLAENKDTDKQELIEENDQEIAELDAISELILDEISDYQTEAGECESVQQLAEVWPPILMPMPFKRELVKVSALSAHDVSDPVDF